ncbi:uncharacterized protein [Hyperolius riggenbachi]|uniref:uncharacterized protein n=1 Tax=Hyperolius riggenbachi TaxID=752182 RepID=UPI0035A2ABA2
MDQIWMRVAAVAGSEGGEDTLRRFLDSIAVPPAPLPNQQPLPAVQPPQMPTDLVPLDVQLPPAIPSTSAAASAAPGSSVRESRSRTKKSRDPDHLSVIAGAGADLSLAPPAKRPKKPRRPYSPDSRGPLLKSTGSRSAVGGSVRASKGGSRHLHTTGKKPGGHLADQSGPSCVPGRPADSAARNPSSSAAADAAPSSSASSFPPAAAGHQASGPSTASLPSTSGSAPAASFLPGPACQVPFPQHVMQGQPSLYAQPPPPGLPILPSQHPLLGAPPLLSQPHPQDQPPLQVQPRVAGDFTADPASDSSDGEAEEPVQGIPAPRPGLKRVVWIVGHSFIFWARMRAKERPYSEQLDLNVDDYHIYWKGGRGMRWASFAPKILSLLDSWPVPDILIVHLGGNDLGKVRTLDLMSQMRQDFQQIHDSFPHTILVFSEMVQRYLWLKGSRRFLEKIRKKE